MKKIILSIAIIFIAIISCKEDINTTSDAGFNKEYISKIDYSTISAQSIKNTSSRTNSKILVFKDMESLRNTIDILDDEISNLDNQFSEYYKELSDEEINDKVDELNFNENLPLQLFNEKLNFSSLYQKLENEEEIWLNNEELDLANDPDDDFIDDETVRALLNENHEVQVGSRIYRFTENGYYIIPQNLYNTNESNYTYIGDGGGETSRVGCRSWRRHRDWVQQGTKAIKCTISHWTYPWGRYAIAKTKNYKKRRRRWKKYRTWCYASARGDISGRIQVGDDYEANCDSQLNFNPNNSGIIKRRKKVKHKIRVSTRTLTGWMHGRHNGAGNINKTSILAF